MGSFRPRALECKPWKPPDLDLEGSGSRSVRRRSGAVGGRDSGAGMDGLQLPCWVGNLCALPGGGGCSVRLKGSPVLPTPSASPGAVGMRIPSRGPQTSSRLQHLPGSLFTGGLGLCPGSPFMPLGP